MGETTIALAAAMFLVAFIQLVITLIKEIKK